VWRKTDDILIEQVPPELEDSQDTHSGLTRYQRCTAATVDTSDTLDINTSVYTTASPEVSFDIFCQQACQLFDPTTQRASSRVTGATESEYDSTYWCDLAQQPRHNYVHNAIWTTRLVSL